ncbi:collagen alpha-1(I) chain-like isoform X2 [Cervus canadensis]|uniref:collagen alpha-1(I) chain-like isoform X2 n=1 Tax=Cervus canadensis TaxID=1574408 RepID=UPI001C9E31F2|nr:collagen alpha-1(I) chain-like isoform X2 [Cervus canadensis]
MVGAGRGGPRHAEQRAGRAAPSIHARPGREEAAASAGTAGRGRPARALARAAPRAGGAAGRRGGGGGVGGNGSSEPVGAAARQAGGRGLGESGVGSEELRKERSSFRGTLERGAVRHGLICIFGRPPPPLLRRLRPLPPPGRGRERGGDAGGGAGGGAGGAGGRTRRLLWLSRLSRSPSPRPAARPHRAVRAPPSHSRGLPASAPAPPTFPAAPLAPARHSAPSPCPAPSSARKDRGRGRPLPLGWGGMSVPGPPHRPRTARRTLVPGSPDSRARVGATGDAAGVGHRGPGPPGDGVRGSHAHLPRSVLACRTGRASTRGLAAAPRRPGVPPRTRIPGAFVASRQEGPEHSGETIVSGQTASGRTWSLAVTRKGTRQSQAGGAGGARGCPVGSGFFSKNSIERTGCKPAKAGRAAACDGGLESCSCLSGHRGERPGPMAAAFGEQDLDAPLTGEEAVQACGAPGPDGHWVSCHFRLPSSLGWKRTGRRSGQPVADAFGMSRRGHACFQEPAVSWRPSSGKRRPGALSPPRRAAAAQTEAPSTPCPGLPGEAGRPSGDAARSRARGRRGGAVACAAAA